MFRYTGMRKFLFCFLFTVVFAERPWVDALLSEMTLEEKIGQLFIIPACPLRDDQHKEDLLKLINDHHIGGIILKSSDPVSQMKFVQDLQRKSRTPLFVAQDAEWGLGMRMTSTVSFPKNLTLGAIPRSEEHLLYRLGREIGRELRMVGTHINFAPVVDVNINPDNPIIHMRSFGEDPDNVARKAIKVMKGMQDEGIIACAKHYPGHGDTIVDSHVDLPLIDVSMERMEKVELYPFQRLIDEGVDMIMTAHLLCNPLNEHTPVPTSLSKTVLQDLLRDKMGFEGLVISDALNMKSLTKNFSPQKIAILAHTSKNDLLLYGDHLSEAVDHILHSEVPIAIEALKGAYWEKRLDIKDLDRTVKKILLVKGKASNNQSPIPIASIEKALNSNEAYQLKKTLYKKAMTLLKDYQNLLPINLGQITYVRIGERKNDWLERIWKPQPLDKVDLKSGHPLLVSIFPTSSSERIRVEKILKESKRPVILVVFDSPYVLRDLGGFATVLLAYEPDPKAQSSAFKVLTGKIPSKGRLPVNVSDEYRLGQGL